MREYPVKFDKCPLCGCKERLLEEIGNELRQKGKVGDRYLSSADPPISMLQLDPTKPTLSAPSVTAITDICARCGFKYTTMVIKQDVPITGKIIQPGQGKQPGQGPGGPFPFMRG